jgi:uncharacterized protein
MDEQPVKRCTAFGGNRIIAAGDLAGVVTKVKEAIDGGVEEPVLIFDDFTSELVEVDFRGALEDVLDRLEKPAGEPQVTKAAPCRPGRPRLGVVAREVTLLPRHWDWLNSQPGGASVALRKLVEEARRVNSGRDRVRHSQNAAYRFMSAMAGNLPGFEESLRALFAGDRRRFDDLVSEWPAGIRDYARKLANVALGGSVWGTDT